MFRGDPSPFLPVVQNSLGVTQGNAGHTVSCTTPSLPACSRQLLKLSPLLQGRVQAAQQTSAPSPWIFPLVLLIPSTELPACCLCQHSTRCFLCLCVQLCPTQGLCPCDPSQPGSLWHSHCPLGCHTLSAAAGGQCWPFLEGSSLCSLSLQGVPLSWDREWSLLAFTCIAWRRKKK